MTWLRWAPEAADDLARVADYLFENARKHAEDLVNMIYRGSETLATFRYRGRHGKKPGTRELVLSPLPYILVYRIAGEDVEVLRILHGAQQWP